jgi:hypothetical protein
MKKILSDGTIAKKNMIVVVISGKTLGNEAATVTKIVKTESGWEDSVECLHIDGNEILGSLTLTEDLDDLRIATSDEIAVFEKYVII